MLRWCKLYRNVVCRSIDYRNVDKCKFVNLILNKGVVIMVLIVFRVILILILVLVFEIVIVFFE